MGKKITKLSRKEARKRSRDEKKARKAPKPSNSSGNSGNTVNASQGPLRAALAAKKIKEAAKTAPMTKKNVQIPNESAKMSSGDAFIDAEDREIKRLEKLLGIGTSKSKKKAESRLNREFSDYEGIGGDFGSFLMQLDDLDDLVKGRSKREYVFGKPGDEGEYDSDELEEVRPQLMAPHILDEDQQELSDVDDDDADADADAAAAAAADDDDEDDRDDDYGDDDLPPHLVVDADKSDSDSDSVSESTSDPQSNSNSSSDADSYEYDYEERLASIEMNSDGDCDDGDSHSSTSSSASSSSEGSGTASDEYDEESEKNVKGSRKRSRAEEEAEEWKQYAYHPVAGQDIYGRTTDSTESSSDAPAKYVPPALRTEAAAEASEGEKGSAASAAPVVDMHSDEARIMRRQVNGILNRLSDATKDATLSALCSLLTAKSRTVCCHVIKEAVLKACASDTQIMASLIPMYAAMIAGLHFAVSTDIGAFMVESFATALYTATSQSLFRASVTDHDLISSKAAGNVYMLLLSLYTLRVLHHDMIVDFLRVFAHISPIETSVNDDKDEDSEGDEPSESELELVHMAVTHCGSAIRADAPAALTDVVAALSRHLRTRLDTGSRSSSSNNTDSTRAQYFLEALTDLKNNRSKRCARSATADTLASLRKWLGTVKTGDRGGSGALSASSSSSAAVALLRITLQDILDIPQKGRWWRAGASWAGRAVNPGGTAGAGDTAGRTGGSAKENKEERRLTKLAEKMKMNTPLRRRIFVVLMSSQDVHDAHERITRMGLKGKDDREIARVITECCAQEKSYNEFYAALAALSCETNRQHKTTFQFCLWDSLKVMTEDASTPQRRILNLARFLAHLVTAFSLPMAVLKPLDFTELPAPHSLFLATFFLALFSGRADDASFAAAMDRVAASPDFETVREGLLLYLTRDMKVLPAGMAPATLKKVKSRRKAAIKTFEKMEIINFMGQD